MKTDGKFYLGRATKSEENILYDPDDLTTHAVVVGMTGSGKTGLCIDLLEEAALNNIPALMIDPKGDITNTLLHFPGLLPADFKPWINADEARRDDKTVEQAAEDTAKLWRAGLKKWDIAPDRRQPAEERHPGGALRRRLAALSCRRSRWQERGTGGVREWEMTEKAR